MLNIEGGNTFPNSAGTGLNRRLEYPIREATDAEVSEIAKGMASSHIWNETYDLKGDPKTCEKYFKDGRFYVMYRPGQSDYEHRLMAFWFGEEGFVGVPVIRFPVSLNHEHDPARLGEFIRSATSLADSKLKQSFYIALPTSEDPEYAARLVRSLCAGDPYPDHLFTVKSPFKEGFDEAICRVNRGYPHPNTGDIKYFHPKDNRPSTKEKVTVSIEKIDDAARAEPYLVHTFAAIMPTMPPWRYYGYEYHGCREALSAKGMQLFVARDRAHPVGCASVNPWGFYGYEVRYIFTHDTYWGKGVGSQLLDEVEKDAAGNGHDRITLTVSDPNPAKKWYLERGYEILTTTQPDTGAIIRGYNVPGEGEVILQKKLEPLQ